MAVRVAIADDSVVIREVLQRVLEATSDVELVSVCQDGEQLRDAIETLAPDVVVTDIHMPPRMADEGIRVATELRQTHPEIGIVVLSADREPAHARTLLEAGSAGRGYLVKGSVYGRQLVTSIVVVALGGSAIDATIADALLRHP